MAAVVKILLQKLQIARKEVAETMYWLELLNSCNYIPNEIYDSMHSDCKDLMSILTATIKTCAV